MRWFVSGLLALAAVWALYVISPYWAFYQLAAALQRGDAAEIAERVNPRALRVSLARQVAGDMAQAAGLGGIAGQDSQVAASTALALADPILGALVTPEGIARLLLEGPAGSPTGAPLASLSSGKLADILAATSWRGFRNLYVSLPPGEPAATRYRLQLRFGRLRWRLVSVEVPPAIRRRIAQRILQKR